MRWELDTEAGALYVYVSEAAVDHQEELPDGVIVDVAADGALVGIEVLGANAPWDAKAVVDRFALGDEDALFVQELSFANMPFKIRTSVVDDRSETTAANNQSVALTA
jgi:uncharacterized protein YuzE